MIPSLVLVETWQWTPLVMLIVLGGLAAGSGLIGALAHASGLDLLRRNSRYAALAAVSLSGVALISDTRGPRRFTPAEVERGEHAVDADLVIRPLPEDLRPQSEQLSSAVLGG